MYDVNFCVCTILLLSNGKMSADVLLSEYPKRADVEFNLIVYNP